LDKTVRDVRNRTYGTVASIKSGHVVQMRPSILNANWPPATRLLVGTAGSAFAAAGLTKGGVAGSILAGLGLGSIAVASVWLKLESRAPNSAGSFLRMKSRW